MPIDDGKQHQPDISLAKKHLINWEPGIELETGLAQTIAYFESLNMDNFRPAASNF